MPGAKQPHAGGRPAPGSHVGYDEQESSRILLPTQGFAEQDSLSTGALPRHQHNTTLWVRPGSAFSPPACPPLRALESHSLAFRAGCSGPLGRDRICPPIFRGSVVIGSAEGFRSAPRRGNAPRGQGWTPGGYKGGMEGDGQWSGAHGMGSWVGRGESEGNRSQHELLSVADPY